MNISLKSLIFIGVLFVVVASGLIYVRVNQENLIKDTFEDRSAQRKVVFNKVFNLSEKQIETLSKDYTYWDEMVEFVATKDQTFAQDNLDTSLLTYSASGVWVFNPENELVYSVAMKGSELVKQEEFPLDPTKLSTVFKDKRLVHFFLASEQGILDVFGATIHPSADSERKTEPKGYFYVARLLDKDFLAEISKATDASVSVHRAVLASEKSEEKGYRQGKSTFYNPLTGFDSKPIAFLMVENQFESVKQFAISSDRDFLIFFALAVAFFCSVFLVIYLQDRSVEHAMQIAKVMTANLTESEARFRAMNDASPFGIFVTDPKGKCIYTNAAYQKISGQNSDESWGDGWLECLHPEDRQRVYAMWYQAASAGGDFSSEHRIKLPDNKEIWVEVKADGIRVEEKLLGYVGVVEDITQTRKYGEEAESRNKELEKLNKNLENREQKISKLEKEIEKLKGGKKR